MGMADTVIPFFASKNALLSSARKTNKPTLEGRLIQYQTLLYLPASLL